MFELSFVPKGIIGTSAPSNDKYQAFMGYGRYHKPVETLLEFITNAGEVLRSRFGGSEMGHLGHPRDIQEYIYLIGNVVVAYRDSGANSSIRFISQDRSAVGEKATQLVTDKYGIEDIVEMPASPRLKSTA